VVDREADLGERLASWLDGLGLTDQLRAAGLPTVERDAHGVAQWSDPDTGRPITAAELEDLDRMLHREGDDPAHAVPVPLVQLRRRAQVRTALLASPWHTYAGLAAIRGTSLDATRFAVHKAADRGALLVVQRDGDTLIPAFQLTESGELRDELAPVLEPLLSSGMDRWQVWGWLTQPAGLLGGMIPQEAVQDLDEAPIVHHAAVRLAERAAADR
jgi:hypothetical protein